MKTRKLAGGVMAGRVGDSADKGEGVWRFPSREPEYMVVVTDDGRFRVVLCRAIGVLGCGRGSHVDIYSVFSWGSYVYSYVYSYVPWFPCRHCPRRQW